MSYQVKRTITSIFSGAFVLIAYSLYTFSRYQSGLLVSDDLKLWAQIMLAFIFIGIAVVVLIQIIFHIFFSVGIAVKESFINGDCDDRDIEKTIKLEMIEDEMDKLIELKSMRVGFIVAGIGFVASLVALALKNPAVVMLNMLFVSFSLGSILEGFARLYYYRKGI